MAPDEPRPESPLPGRVTRRSLAKGVAWSAPVVMTTGAAPALAASTTTPCQGEVAPSSLTLNGPMNPISGSTQAVGSNWTWRGSGHRYFRTSGPVAAGNDTSMLTNVWTWNMSLHDTSATTCAANTPDCNKQFTSALTGSVTNTANVVGNQPTGCTTSPGGPPAGWGSRYFVFKGDPIRFTPAIGGLDYGVMALHSKLVTLCAGRKYTFSFDWWTGEGYPHDVTMQVGWGATFPSAGGGFSNPGTWNPGSTTAPVTLTTGTAKTGTASFTYTPTTTQNLYLVFRVVPATKNGTLDLVKNDQSCDGAANDIAVGNFVLTIA